MMRERLNEVQKEILRVYQDASKRKKSENFSLTRREVAKSFFRRAETTRSKWKLPFLKEEGEIEKMYRERKLPYEVETEKQAWQRRAKNQKPAAGDIRDWRERIGLRTGLRGIYSKKQEILRRGLKDLVKKGYLKSSGSGIGSQYRPTEKGLKAKIPRF
jgi:phage-related minor tail protein